MLENTLENKARYFAQYWGQRVLYWNNAFKYELIDTNLSKWRLENGWIKLKRISSITDEDAIETTKISICETPFNVEIKRVNEQLEATNASNHSTWTLVLSGVDMYFKCGDYRTEIDSSAIFTVYQYIQSKGYALPFMGLSVEQLIEYGWLKLSQ